MINCLWNVLALLGCCFVLIVVVGAFIDTTLTSRGGYDD